MDTLHGAEAREKIWSLIKDIRVAQLATTDDSGRIFHARPMIAQNLKDLAGRIRWHSMVFHLRRQPQGPGDRA